MAPDNMLFEEFLAGRMREKNITLKRLAELSGIAPAHLENMLHGNFGDMPSMPYFRGYVLRIGKILDFNGHDWWERIKGEHAARGSGAMDALPENRFVKRKIPKWIWAVVPVGIIIIIYLLFALPGITGKPSLVITNPPQNPYTTTSTIITLTGTVKNADALYLLNPTDPSSTEEIAIGPDGSWQKTVFLGNSGSGLNSFKLRAQKFLGGETDVLQEIISEPVGTLSSTVSSSLHFPAVHFESTTPATGSYFN